MANTKFYRKALHAACVSLRAYIVRWQTKLQQSLGVEGYTLLLALLDGVTEFIVFLETAFPGDYTPV